MDQDKSSASRKIYKTKKVALDWSHDEKSSIRHHKTRTNMESTREEEKRTANKYPAARHGVGSEEDGVHLAGNYHLGATHDPVESFRR